MTGASLTAIPELDISEVPPSGYHRSYLTQRVFRHFWKRWSAKNLSQLQQCLKCLRLSINLKIGDLILIRTELSQCFSGI